MKQKETETHLEIPLEENINKVVVEGEQARSIDEAISILRYLSMFQRPIYRTNIR